MSTAIPSVNIAIAFDQNYLNPFLALLESLFQNNKDSLIHLHVIKSGITDQQTRSIEDYVKRRNSFVKFYQIDEALVGSLQVTGKWTVAAYYRLFFPGLVSPDVKKLLYLDTDTIVVGDLATLFSIDLENAPVAAVYDSYVKKQPLIGIEKEGEYFNSGVLMINVPRWNEMKVSEKAVQYLHRFPERILYVDQCALNAVLAGHWKKLDFRFNVLYSYLPGELSRKDVFEFIQDKVVIHFTLQRPWNFLCRNRLRVLYFEFLQQSPLRVRGSRYSDFSFSKLPLWLKLRIQEIYLDSTILRVVWRRFKRMRT